MKKLMTLFFLLQIASVPIFGQPKDNSDDSLLKRRGFLGVLVRAFSQESSSKQAAGVEVINVFDDSTAKLAGITNGDILVAINDQILKTPADVGGILTSAKAGEKVKLEISRNGETKIFNTELVPLPKEKFDNAEVIHDTVKTDSGRLRSILTMPNNKSNPPVVFILQGFDCSSIEKPLTPQDAYIKLINMLHKNGYATYRLEKSNVGDSEGMPCREIGFNLETKGFIDGLNKLASSPLINKQQIYLLGISLGGIWAPILANEVPVKGIISYGTIAKTWEEYGYENSRRQWLLAGTDYSKIEKDLKLSSIFWNELFTTEKKPREIMDAKPELKSLAAHFTINPATGDYTHIYGRHYSFVKEINQLNVAEKWENVKAKTLLLWGIGDYIASESDQKLIEKILLRKGRNVTLKYVNSDHYWRQSNSFEESYQNLRENKSPAFQEEILSQIEQWLASVNSN